MGIVKPDDFMQSAVQIAGSSGKIVHQMDNFKQIEVVPAAQDIFAEAAHNLVYDKSAEAPIEPKDLLETRRNEDRGNDVWTTYNRLQENIISGGIKGVKIGGQW